MNKNDNETSNRIQTSVINGVEKKVLVFLAHRQPRWMTSNILTVIGVIGAMVISIGYLLASVDLKFLWLSSLGFIINWYGDSLDGTLARVRNKQRPLFGYYLDHTVDVINELAMFLGLGLSGLMHFEIAIFLLLFYLMLTINVSINAHLKKEFCLTYAKLGPTEFRIIAILINTLYMYSSAINQFSFSISLFDKNILLSSFDIMGH